MSTDKTIAVGIAGVRGYKGTETARRLAAHPVFRVVMVASDAMAGSRLRDLDPDLVRDGNAQAVGYNDTVSAARDFGVKVMFLATRSALCGKLAASLLDAGIRVIDLSGAHLLKDGDAHLESYGFLQADPAISAEAVYGLPECTDHETLAKARIVANPTAYGTAVLLALRPLEQAKLVVADSVVIDVKAAASAAGRTARISLLLSELAGNMYASKIESHPQTPEILQELATVTGPDYHLTVVSHMLPTARGMLATCYLRVPGSETTQEKAERVRDTLRAAYAGEPFVRVLDRAEEVQLRAVVGTNRYVVGASADPRGGRVVVVCALDNLIKGAAGQAIQTANLMFGLDQTTALRLGTGLQP